MSGIVAEILVTSLVHWKKTVKLCPKGPFNYQALLRARGGNVQIPQQYRWLCTSAKCLASPGMQLRPSVYTFLGAKHLGGTARQNYHQSKKLWLSQVQSRLQAAQIHRQMDLHSLERRLLHSRDDRSFPGPGLISVFLSRLWEQILFHLSNLSLSSLWNSHSFACNRFHWNLLLV